MRRLLFILIVTLTLFSCNNSNSAKPSFDELEFSYTNSHTTSYSIKFTAKNNIYVARYLPSPIKIYKGCMTLQERQRLDSFINTIDFKKIDTSYYQNYDDGDGYQLFLKTKKTEKLIFAHSNSVPDKLKNLAYWIVATKNKTELIQSDTTLSFKNVMFFIPPIMANQTTNSR